MARLARIILPCVSHHVTQRGNRIQAPLAELDGSTLYRDLLSEQGKANGVACWASCLIPNHAHFILAPATAQGL